MCTYLSRHWFASTGTWHDGAAEDAQTASRALWYAFSMAGAVGVLHRTVAYSLSLLLYMRELVCRVVILERKSWTNEVPELRSSAATSKVGVCQKNARLDTTESGNWLFGLRLGTLCG